MSIFLISPYNITANQDKAINQNVINIVISHKDIVLKLDLLHVQESCLVLDEVLDLLLL